jgi:hypothetical protein
MTLSELGEWHEKMAVYLYRQATHVAKTEQWREACLRRCDLHLGYAQIARDNAPELEEIRRKGSGTVGEGNCILRPDGEGVALWAGSGQAHPERVKVYGLRTMNPSLRTVP